MTGKSNRRPEDQREIKDHILKSKIVGTPLAMFFKMDFFAGCNDHLGHFGKLRAGQARDRRGCGNILVFDPYYVLGWNYRQAGVIIFCCDV